MKENETSAQRPTIKSWPASERPRERLIEHGPEALSDAELLAILLRNGVQGKDVLALSRELLTKFGSLRNLFSSGWRELAAIRGLGTAKVTSLLALSELSKRSLKEGIVGKEMIRDPDSVMQYLAASLRDRKREIFKILFLNKANRVIDEADLFEGTIDEAVIHPREVIKAALDRHASYLVLVHNHPSGRVEPSFEDKEMTRRLDQACRSVSLRILDHIIIADDQSFSFREHGLLAD